MAPFDRLLYDFLSMVGRCKYSPMLYHFQVIDVE